MKDVLIYGAGGLGKEMIQLINQINATSAQWNIIGFVDDGKVINEKIRGFSVLGGISFLQNRQTELSVVIAIADPKIKKSIVEKLTNPMLSFPTIIHPTVFVDYDVEVGEGSIICAGVLMTTTIKIGKFSLINLGCTLGHDCEVGDFTSLMPSVNISGYVKTGEQCYVGVGAMILQGLSIGNQCQIGAGAVVTKSFDDQKKIMGIPAHSI